MDALAYLGPRLPVPAVGDKMVDWSFRWKRLRPLGLSRTATLIAWEPAGLQELAGSVVEGSGTGELNGLRGEGGFKAALGQSAEITLDYWFE